MVEKSEIKVPVKVARVERSTALKRVRKPSAQATVTAMAEAVPISISKPLERKRLDQTSGNDQKSRHFIDVNAKGAKFVGVDFSASVFERVYFRQARFENCNFTGAKFTDCNFRDAVFVSTNLTYADFNRCLLNVHEVVASFPSEPNLRKESLQNLRANCSSIGDVRSISFLVLEEIEAACDHHWRALIGKDDFYRRKYGTLVSKVGAAGSLCYYKINDLVWGYGEKPLALLSSLLTFLLALSFVNFWSVLPQMSFAETGYGLRIFQHTFEMFLNTGPEQKFEGFLAVNFIIGALRYIYAGLLVTTLVRSISHR